MAEKYLNEAGLQALWAKIKQATGVKPGDNSKIAVDLQSQIISNTNMILDAHAVCSMSATSPLEVGVASNVNVTITGKFVNDPAKSLKITDNNGTLKKEDTTGTLTSMTYSESVQLAADETKVFKGEAKFADTVSKTASATVRAYRRIYYLCGGESAPSAAEILAASKRSNIVPSANGEYTFTPTDGQYLWLCVPSGVSVPSNAKEKSGGFGMTLASNVTVTGVDCNANDTNVTYTCVRSATAKSAGSQTIIYS